MAQNVQVCDISEDLKEKLKTFRFRKSKTNCALIMKIDRESQQVVLEDEMEELTMEELQNELPPHQPRYVEMIYCKDHGDGRVSYPLLFIFVSPAGCKPELQMMYAGTKTSLVKQAEVAKVFELREVEELTDEWINTKI